MSYYFFYANKYSLPNINSMEYKLQDFDLLVDPKDIIDISMTPEEYYAGRKEVADKLIESRSTLEKYGRRTKKRTKKDGKETT